MPWVRQALEREGRASPARAATEVAPLDIGTNYPSVKRAATKVFSVVCPDMKRKQSLHGNHRSRLK